MAPGTWLCFKLLWIFFSFIFCQTRTAADFATMLAIEAPGFIQCNQSIFFYLDPWTLWLPEYANVVPPLLVAFAKIVGSKIAMERLT